MKIMMTLLALITLSCAQDKVALKPKPTIELREISPTPPVADGMVRALPAKPDAEQEWCIEVLSLPTDGIVLSESKALQAAKLRVYAEEMNVAASYNKTYCEMWSEAALQQINAFESRELERMEDEQRWWNRHRLNITFIGGLTLGSVITILVVYGVNQAGD